MDENILERIRRHKQYQILDRDKSVKKMWKDYQKATKNVPAKLNKQQFYDVYIKHNKVSGNTRATATHEGA